MTRRIEDDRLSSREPHGEVMISTTATRLVTSLRSARSDRSARRALESELSDYATAADRDELAALLDGRGAVDSDTVAILSGQARADLFRVG
jgi:hypothetical protein